MLSLKALYIPTNRRLWFWWLNLSIIDSVNLLTHSPWHQFPILKTESGTNTRVKTIDTLVSHGLCPSVLWSEISTNFSLLLFPVLAQSSYFLTLNKSLMSCLSLFQPSHVSAECSLQNTNTVTVFHDFTFTYLIFLDG